MLRVVVMMVVVLVVLRVMMMVLKVVMIVMGAIVRCGRSGRVHVRRLASGCDRCAIVRRRRRCRRAVMMMMVRKRRRCRARRVRVRMMVGGVRCRRHLAYSGRCYRVMQARVLTVRVLLRLMMMMRRGGRRHNSGLLCDTLRRAT